MKNNGQKIIAQNKKAHHEYFIEETYECGIVLVGTEIKSIREGKASINEAYCSIIKEEMYIEGMHISKYEQGNIFNHDPDRKKKLLLHKREIIKLQTQVTRNGYTIVPLSVYLKDSKCKVEIALCKGKKLYDKRESLKQKTIKQEQEKEYNSRLKNY